MLPGAWYVSKLFRVEIAQSQVSPCLIWMQCQQLLQLIRRRLKAAFRLECPSKIVSRIRRIGADGDGFFPCGGSCFEAARFKRRQP